MNNANKRLIVLPRDEGADRHSGGTNLGLVAQLVFDWLDGSFVGEPSRATSGEVMSATT